MITVTTGLVAPSVRSESQESEPQAKAIGLPANRTARTTPRKGESKTALHGDVRGATKQVIIDAVVPP